MSSCDLSNQFDEKSKEYDKLLFVQQEVEQAILNLRRQIINLQMQKSELDISKSKATYNVRHCKIELELIKNAFFKARVDGV